MTAALATTQFQQVVINRQTIDVVPTITTAILSNSVRTVYTGNGDATVYYWNYQPTTTTTDVATVISSYPTLYTSSSSSFTVSYPYGHSGYFSVGCCGSMDVVRESKSLLRKRLNTTRGSIKRALSLMTGLGMDNEVKIFLGNEAMEVAHENSAFKFVLSRNSRSILDLTEHPGYSTPYKLELRTKDDRYVANLCVIVKDTPMLDQLLAVSMFIKSGCENVLLEEANFLAKTKDAPLLWALARRYPYLKDKLLRGLDHSDALNRLALD